MGSKDVRYASAAGAFRGLWAHDWLATGAPRLVAGNQGAAVRCGSEHEPRPRVLTGSVEHVELRRMLGEALAQNSAREIRWTSGGGLALNVGRFSQTREQALQAFSARDQRLELHGAVAARAEQVDVEAALEQLGPWTPSAAAWAVGRFGSSLGAVGWLFVVGMLPVVPACWQFGNDQRAPC